MALLSTADIAELRAIQVSGLLLTSVGGTSWVPLTTSGDGVTSDITVSDGTPITGYVEQRRTTAAPSTAGGAVVPEGIKWVFVQTGATAPAQGGVIRSSSNSSLRFRVVGLDQWDVYDTYILEPITT